MTNKKNTTHVRVYPETNERAKQLARELSAIQKHDIQAPEVFRRAFNIPNIDLVLKADAELKRRLK